MEDGFGRLDGWLGGVVGEVLTIPVVRVAVLLVVAYVILLWFASAWWTLADLRRRSGDLVTPYLAAAAVILASPLLFPAALIAYVALRPPRTLQQQRWIELEATLAAADAIDARCPGCLRLVGDDWLRCPDCRRRLAFECGTCGRPIGTDWELCAWCGTEFVNGGGTPGTATVDAPVRPVPVASGGSGGFAPRPTAAGSMSVVPGPRHRA